MFTIRFPAASAAVALILALGACSKPAPAPVATAPAPASGVTDMDISNGVKTALLRDDMTKSFEVIVFSNKGDVRLAGVMDTQAQVDKAMALTRSVQGVHSVRAELRVKP